MNPPKMPHLKIIWSNGRIPPSWAVTPSPLALHLKQFINKEGGETYHPLLYRIFIKEKGDGT